MNLQDLGLKVSSLNQDISQLTQKKERIEIYGEQIKDEQAALYKNFSFLQKYINTFWTDDKKNAIKYVAIDRILEKIPAEKYSLARKIRSQKNLVREEIVEYLCEKNPAFLVLENIYQEINKIHMFMKRFLNEIDEALDAIDSAEDMETLDLFSNNKGVSMFSSLNNSEAQDEIEDVQDLLPELKKNITTFNGLTKDMKSGSLDAIAIEENNISDVESFDLFADLCLDLSFDFTSIFSLSALNDAEDEMQKLKDQSTSIQNKIKKVKTTYETLRSQEIQTTLLKIS